MTRLFDDEQSSSLITSMMNPESNASKFIEQGEDIGLPRDVTMDILNKYATYGANTGIGNIGGERLVNALNEEYRKQVDAPLQEMPKEALIGGVVEFLKSLVTKAPVELSGQAANQSLAAIDALSVPDFIRPDTVLDAAATGLVRPESVLDAAAGEAISKTLPTGLEDAVNPLLPTSRLEKFNKYLEDNPEVARVLERSGSDIGKIIGQAIGMAGGGKLDEGSVLGRTLFIQGGEVDGPGGPKEDLVPIWASDSEYVVSEKGVRNMGGGDFEKGIAALDKINFGKA